MTLSNILSFVTVLYGIFEMFYGLQITLNMPMPTLHTPNKRGIVLLRGLL
jgi:hypothetical protein